MSFPVQISGVLEFEVKSGKVMITDPCYKLDTWCALNNIKVLPGKYSAFVIKSDEGDWGVRVAQLYVIHSDYLFELVDDYLTKVSSLDNHYQFSDNFCADLGLGQVDLGSVGVDSGQMSVIDSETYAHTDTEFNDEFYDMVCALTLNQEQWGVFENGAVTSSGYGDGSYYVTAFTDENTNVGFMIDFGLLYDEEDED